MSKPIPALTGIRGIAALWVVLYHMQDAAKLDPRFAPLQGIPLLFEGYRGVDLFFVLSGFILFYVHIEDFRTLTWAATRRYFASRFWRVYPLNAVVLMLIIALAWIAPGFRSPASFHAAAVIQSLLLAQRWLIPDFGSINGPSWSLSVEIIGYAAFPFVAWGLNRSQSPWKHLIVAGLCLGALVAASYGLGFADFNITGRLTIVRMFPAFVAGTALAAGFVTQRSRVDNWAGVIATVSILCILLLCSVPIFPVLTIVPIAALVFALAYQRGAINQVMASRLVVWLGRVSFSLYLTHFTVLGLMVWATSGGKTGPLRNWLYMASVFTVIIAVAATVYYGAERPLTRISRRFGRA